MLTGSLFLRQAILAALSTTPLQREPSFEEPLLNNTFECSIETPKRLHNLRYLHVSA